uniref:Coiled-coil domain-containing protein 9B n=1 Tax=Denticeps clupeoides TaxID=299321 RepID=A0AAY4D1Z5_9TELE
MNDAMVSTDMMKQKDEALDKKIEALRKKNEALMKRYQEVEEDKMKAEQEGMALQSRKGHTEDLSVTNKSTNLDLRVVMKHADPGVLPRDRSPREVTEPAKVVPCQFAVGRGKRRQLFVTMVGNNKGKRLVSEKLEPCFPHSEGRSLKTAEDEREGGVELFQRGKHSGPGSQNAEWPETQDQPDLSIPTSREEQLEYLRWKKEREEIDRERVARHKNSKGQWRRAWDMDKPQLARRRIKKMPFKTQWDEPRGNQYKSRDKRSRNVAVVGSKAKGKDRLTGRARRWDTHENSSHVQTSDSSLEAFLQELDALGYPEYENHSSNRGDAALSAEVPTGADRPTAEFCKAEGLKEPATLETISADGSLLLDGDCMSKEQAKTEASSPKGTEKRVRFSEELIQGSNDKTPNFSMEARGSSLKDASLCKTVGRDKVPETLSGSQDQEVPESPEKKLDEDEEDLIPLSAFETDLDNVLSPESRSEINVKASASSDNTPAWDQALGKNGTSRCTGISEEHIDPNLSVLGLDTTGSHSDQTTCTEKARENGKVV